MTRREAILNGALAAARLHKQSKTEEQLIHTRGPVNVFTAILGQEAALLFRPLEGLLGASLSRPARGVIISTQRPLSIQRFTGAHELGHVVLHHDFSLDGEEILNRPQALNSSQEVQANSFGSDFLIPSWLPRIHGKAQGWDRDSLKKPAIVYQLALRMGASYEATCIALRRHGLIDAPTFSALCKVQPRTIKQQLLPDHKPEHWRRDVWVLTERDEGAVIEGQPDDLFLFRLNEKSGAGYLWDIGQLKQCGLVVVQDTRDIDQQFDLDATTVGDFVQRIITAQAEDAAIGEVRLALERPWNRSAEPAEQLHLRFDLRGKEQGLPRALRSQLNAA